MISRAGDFMVVIRRAKELQPTRGRVYKPWLTERQARSIAADLRASPQLANWNVWVMQHNEY